MCTPGPSNDVRAADLAARFLVHDPRRVAFIKSYGRNISDFAKAQFGERRSQWRTWLLRGALIVKNALFEAIGLPRAVRNMLRDALTHVERHIDAHKDMVKLLRGDTTHVVAGKVIVPAAYAKFTSWKAMAKADPSALVCLNTVREPARARVGVSARRQRRRACAAARAAVGEEVGSHRRFQVQQAIAVGRWR
jgi:hypothetical protein